MPWMTATAKIPVEEIVRAQMGMSLDDYKNIVIRQRLLSRRCMAHEINPSEHDLRKFFDRFPDLFQHPVKYHAAHILITPLNPRDLFLSSSLRANVRMTDYQTTWLERRIQLMRDQNINLGEENVQEVDSAWAQARDRAEQIYLQLSQT